MEQYKLRDLYRLNMPCEPGQLTVAVIQGTSSTDTEKNYLLLKVCIDPVNHRIMSERPMQTPAAELADLLTELTPEEYDSATAALCIGTLPKEKREALFSRGRTYSSQTQAKPI